jgi:hypothetical protein
MLAGHLEIIFHVLKQNKKIRKAKRKRKKQGRRTYPIAIDRKYQPLFKFNLNIQMANSN